jgi:hypothetical protein
MRLAPVSAWSLRALVVGIVLTLSACNATLAPGYDPELVSDLNAANEQALILFSEVSQGASTARYAALAPTYDALIGKFDALRLRAAAREVPDLGREIGARLCSDDDDPSGCVNASPGSLEAIVENFQKMKQNNQKNGLTPLEVKGLKNAYETSIEQVLLVETSLKS